MLALHITPFGNHTFVISDSRALFTSDLSYFSRLVRGQEGLLYSFESGIGMNIAGMISTMLDPIDFIVLAFDISDYATMYSCAITVSISLCGLTMFHFLSSAYEQGDVRNLVFSSVYALVGFNVAYCFIYTFLLPVALLPLIALGIRKILLGRRPWLFLLTMAFAILSNYYMGYMLCIASVVLFCMWYVKDRDDLAQDRKGIWIRFFLSIVCAGLLATVTWLPSLLSIAGGRLEQNSILDLTFNENMGILDTGAKLFTGANNTSELSNGLPNIFCTSFVVFLAIAYFIDGRNAKRAKVAFAIALGFYFLTFYIRAFSMAMQGFSETNWFNYRYSYVFSFVLIVMAREEFAGIRELSLRDMKRAAVAFAILIVAVFSKQYGFVTGGNMLIDVAVLALIIAAVLWNRRDPRRAPMGQLAVLVLILSSVELYANFCICLHNVQDWGAKADEYHTDLFYGSIIADAVRMHDTEFYRMANEHLTNERCSNDPRLFGYNGTSYYGSNARNSLYRGLCKLGQAWFGNRTWYAEGEPAAFDSLLGLKYLVARRDLTAEKGYENVLTVEEDTVFENHNALPIALLANGSAGGDGMLADMGKNPFENHNAIWRYLSGGEEDVFTEERELSFTYLSGAGGMQTSKQDAESYCDSISLAASDSTSISDSESGSDSEVESEDDGDTSSGLKSPYRIECTFVASKNGPIYAYNAGVVSEESGYQLEPMQYLGTFSAGDEVKVRIELMADVSDDLFNVVCAEYHVAYANDDVLARYCQELQSRSGTIRKDNDSHLVGSVKTTQAGRLFFTIPYDEGWTLTVDGREVPLEIEAGFFMSSPIAEGSHEYELTFFPRGMREGMVVSGAALVLTAAFVIADTRLRHKLTVKAPVMGDIQGGGET